jgi:hypothetical protein
MIVDGINFIGLGKRTINFVVENYIEEIEPEEHHIIAVIGGLKSFGFLLLTDKHILEVSRRDAKEGFWSNSKFVVDILNEIPLNEIRKVKRDKAITQGMMMFTGSVGEANVFKVETETQEYSWEFRTTGWSRSPPEIKSDIDMFGRLITERISKHDVGHHGSADEIRKLAKLRDEGIITDSEFQGKKRQLLGM